MLRVDVSLNAGTVQLHDALAAKICVPGHFDPCWRHVTRYYALIIGISVAIGGACMWDAHKYVPRAAEGRPRASSLTEQLSLLQSFRILRKPYFWSLFRSVLAAVVAFFDINRLSW